jgi:hypothetical protein
VSNKGAGQQKGNTPTVAYMRLYDKNNQKVDIILNFYISYPTIVVKL